MQLLLLIFLSLFTLYGCDENKRVNRCIDNICPSIEDGKTVEINYTNAHTISLGQFANFRPDLFERYDNQIICTLPQELINAGFTISSDCDINGVPLKTLSGTYSITVKDYETSKEQSVFVDITVTGGLGCNVSGYEITIVDYPEVGSPTFSFCSASDQFINYAAKDVGILLPGNGCYGMCPVSLATLVSGSVDQSQQSYLDNAQIMSGYVLYDVAFPLSDLTLNLTPAPL